MSQSYRTEPAEAVFDLAGAKVKNPGADDLKQDMVPFTIRPEAGWESVMTEDFEGSFPSAGWSCSAQSGYADALWDDQNYRADGGSWSMFCAASGTNGVLSPADYPANMNTWAVYGPFDLSDATSARLDFSLWLESESNYDYFKYLVSVDGTQFYGYQTSGSTSGSWIGRTFDLTTVPTLGDISGESQVYIALIFESDASNQYQGAFVDDVLLQKYTDNVTGPTDPEILVDPLSLTLDEPATEQALESNGPQDLSVGIPGSLVVTGDFVPKQVIVKFRGSDLNSMQTLNAASSAFQEFSRTHQVKILKELLRPVSTEKAGGDASTVLLQLEHSGALQDVIRELLEMDVVEYAEPNYIMHHEEDESGPEWEPSDPLFANQWGLKNTGNALSVGGSQVGTPGADVNAASAWNTTRGSSGIVVAVIDDGIDPSHPEFIGRIVSGYDFVEDDSDPTAGSGAYHGNACAGIIGAADDGSGVVGVAPDISLMPLRACDDGCYHSDIISAIYYAVDNGADVISISLGGGSFSSLMEDAVDYAYDHNVVVLASAGNDNSNNTSSPHYPSGYANSISVGAMSPCGDRKTPSTCDGETWWGSNYGDLDFITPGTRIYTTDISGSGGYGSGDYMTTFNGTSAACPFAAGVAALLLSSNPTLSATEVRQYMQQGSVDLGTPGYDSQTGYGRLDAFLAIQVAQGGGENQIFIVNQGSGDLTVSGISDNEAWMTLSHPATPLVIPPGGNAIVEVVVDWGQLSISETGQVTILSNDADEGTVVVDVTANPLGLSTHNITAAANPPSGGSVSGAGSYEHGATATLEASASTGYSFSNWTESSVVQSTNASYSFVVTGDRNLVANFTADSYTIDATVVPAESGTVSGTGTYDHGQTATLEATASGGYGFSNWTESSVVQSTDASYSFVVTGDRDLIANFTVDSYTISAAVIPAGSGTISGTGTYDLNQLATLVATPATAYEFVEWTENNTTVSTEPTYAFNVTSDRNLQAHFSVLEYDVTLNANPPEGGSVSGAGSFTHGLNVTVEATEATGYSFSNWTESSVVQSTDASYTFTILGDRDLVANFTADSYTVNAAVVPAGSGTVSGTGSYTYNQSATLVATPATGYEFVEWTENSTTVSTQSTYVFTVTSDRNLEARFSIIHHDVTLDADPVAGGSVSGAGSYEHGASVTVEATTATGYSFNNWTENSVVQSTDASYTFEVTSDRDLTANFTINNYTVNAAVVPAGSGTVSGTGSYTYMQTATLVATPATGYEFVNWTIEDVEVSTNPTYTFTVYENTAVVANFARITLTVTVVAEPSDWGTVSGGGQYLYGETAELAAIPADGKIFSFWADQSDVEVSTENPYSFTVVENRTLKALFESDPTGIVEDQLQSFELYPNPVGDRLYIRFKLDMSQDIHISIYDLNGRMIMNYEGRHQNQDVLELNTAQLSPGAYLIKMVNSERSFTGKVVKK